ncbi:MAG: DUF3306 domain-containing protein [Pseudomonadota bacterium]
MSDEGFLGRWSKRKLETKEKVVEPAGPSPQPSPQRGEGAGQLPLPRAGEGRGEGAAQDTKPPAPTLEDTRSLTPQSDFRRFIAPEVDPQVKNAALRKLFADPHFNVMDGLDTYIDDYSKPDPLPESMLRQLASAKFLKLFDDEDEEKNTAGAQGREVADDLPSQSVAQSVAADPATPPDTHADPDLRLQQDDAPGPAGPGAKPE